MPLYEYRCSACAHQFEVIQSFSAKPLRKCEKCGGKVEKLISRGGFILKGGGWFASDYNPSKPAAKEGAADAPSSEKSAEKSGDKAADKGSDKPAAAESAPAKSEGAKPAAKDPPPKKPKAAKG